MKELAIMGRLGHEPKLRELDGGRLMLSLSVAIADREKVGNEWKDATTWIDVVYFGARAKWLSEKLVKGDPVVGAGDMRLRSYVDRNGKERIRVELHATKLDPCPTAPRREGSGPGPGSGSGGRPEGHGPQYTEQEDDLPF